MNRQGHVVPAVHIAPHAMGMASALEFALEFGEWASECRHLTPELIQRRWGVSRATSYRYLTAWNAVQGRRAAA